MVGRTISHYRIVAQLGAGGMGVVYRAEDARLGREVALKFVSEDLAHDEQAIQRLRSEARAASALNHGNICTIYDIGEDDGRPFIVMELMKGDTLRDRLARGPVKIHQLVDVGIEIADALHAAHRDGIVHRDIKPGNIFLTDRGHVKVLDFGLAKLTTRVMGSETTTGGGADLTVAGVTLGTIAYMSPEQATGEELDGRTDIFSLGVVLYECATGRHPFPGKTSAVTLAAILNRAPVAPVALNPEIPLRLQDVINNCLEKDRELRYQSAADLRADLKRVRRDIESGHTRAIEALGSGAVSTTSTAGLSGSRSPTPPSGSNVTYGAADSTPPVATARTSRGFLAGVAIAAIVIIAIGGYAIWQRTAPAPSEEVSEAVLSEAALRNRLALAQASIAARNYRAALGYAAEVLAAQSGHSEALKIQDEARVMLARFDSAMADARRRLASGDAAGAARALETARAIDPAAPSVSGMSAQLAEHVRQAQQEKQAVTRAPAPPRPEPQPRATPAPPAAPPPAVTSTSPSSSSAKTEQPIVPRQPPPTAAPSGAAPSSGVPDPAPSPVPPSPVPPAPPSLVPPPAPAAPPAPDDTRGRAPAAPTAEEDEAAIRRVLATYARAIETKDLALFRSIKPNLSPAEERRLQDGFRAVTSQRVHLTPRSIERRGDQAAVVVARQDTIEVGSRRQTTESQQMIALARTPGGWVIVEIR